jgi:ribosome-binding factor A
MIQLPIKVNSEFLVIVGLEIGKPVISILKLEEVKDSMIEVVTALTTIKVSKR